MSRPVGTNLFSRLEKLGYNSMVECISKSIDLNSSMLKRKVSYFLLLLQWLIQFHQQKKCFWVDSDFKITFFFSFLRGSNASLFSIAFSLMSVCSFYMPSNCRSETQTAFTLQFLGTIVSIVDILHAHPP